MNEDQLLTCCAVLWCAVLLVAFGAKVSTGKKTNLSERTVSASRVFCEEVRRYDFDGKLHHLSARAYRDEPFLTK